VRRGRVTSRREQSTDQRFHAHVAIYANGQPLSSSQAASATGLVIACVNGERSSGDPSQIGLQARQLIQLDVGDETPPRPVTFPPGL
jgi:hypothetical protein